MEPLDVRAPLALHLGLLASLALAVGCGEHEAPAIELRLAAAAAPSQPEPPHPKEPEYGFAIGAIFSPERSLDAWERFVGHLGQVLGVRLRMVFRRTYAEANALLRTGEALAGIVCTGAYVAGHEEFGLLPIAAPIMADRYEYRSYIIVAASSPVRSFDELRGKSFAFSDPLSNTGFCYPAYLCAMEQESARGFFARTLYTYGHDASIEAIANGLAEGAAVDSLVYEFLREKEPALVARTRVIARSEPFAIQPIVASPAAPCEFRENLARVLLAMHETASGCNVLAALGAVRFVEADDGAYAAVRAMRAAIRAREGARRP